MEPDRAAPDPVVTCRPDGLHIAASPRLWVVANRLDDLARGLMLASEPAAQKWLGWPGSNAASAR